MNRQKSFENERPTLYLVATPIGNLDEMTYRSINTLKNAKYIAAEDTRNTVKLLNHFEISTKLISHHEHNIKQSIPKLIQLLEEGNDIALVSDAGYPAISDPGYELVKEAIEHEINVVPTFDDAKNSFELDGKEYDVPCVFQVWIRKENLRQLALKTFTHNDFTFVEKSEADFAIQRVGVAAGKVKIDFEKYAVASHYFIKANEKVRKVFEKINWSSVKGNTAGNPSISKSELINLYNQNK